MIMKRWIGLAIGITIGTLGGFLYWYYVGCHSGACAITSSPVNSTLCGVMGALLANVFTASPTNKT